MPTVETAWISSNAFYGGKWHLGVRREMRGDRTGRLMDVYYLTACSGRQLGGPWGYTRVEQPPHGSEVCPRCERLAAKVQPREADALEAHIGGNVKAPCLNCGGCGRVTIKEPRDTLCPACLGAGTEEAVRQLAEADRDRGASAKGRFFRARSFGKVRK